MQYDTIEELILELSLYPNRKIDILEDCSKYCKYGWFAVAKDGNCALFDDNSQLDDINKVKSIDEFMVPSNVENINIPDSVTVINAWAFNNHKNLTNVLIPNSVTSIGWRAFYKCSGLTSVMIPNSVTEIGWYAFSGCSGLKSVTIPDSVTNIRLQTFAYCSGLKSVTIPDSVTSIGTYAFYGCSNLKELVFKGKTLEEVQSMENYPFGVKDELIIRCEK